MAKAKTTLEFDANTAKLIGKLERVNRKTKSIGDTFSRSTVGLDKMAGQIGSVLTLSTAIGAVWENTIAVQMERAARAAETLQGGARQLARAVGITDTAAGSALVTGNTREIALTAGLTGGGGKARAADIAFAQASTIRGEGQGPRTTKLLGQLELAGQDAFATLQGADRIRGVTGGGSGQLNSLLQRTFVAAKSSDTTSGEIGTLAANVLSGDAGGITSVNEVLGILGGAKGDEAKRVRTRLEAIAKRVALRGPKYGITEGTLIDRIVQVAALPLADQVAIVGEEAVSTVQLIARQGGAASRSLEATLSAGVGDAIGFAEQQILSNPETGPAVRLNRATARNDLLTNADLATFNTENKAKLENAIPGRGLLNPLERGFDRVTSSSGAAETATRSAFAVGTMGASEALLFGGMMAQEFARSIAVHFGLDVRSDRMIDQLAGEPE